MSVYYRYVQEQLDLDPTDPNYFTFSKIFEAFKVWTFGMNLIGICFIYQLFMPLKVDILSIVMKLSICRLPVPILSKAKLNSIKVIDFDIEKWFFGREKHCTKAITLLT